MENKQTLTKSIIIQRILALPFFAIILFIGAIILWANWMFNFTNYGGEIISYTKERNRKTIQDVYEKLTENLEYEKTKNR